MQLASKYIINRGMKHMRTLSRVAPKNYSVFPSFSDPFFSIGSMGDLIDQFFSDTQSKYSNIHYNVDENENDLNLKIFFPVEEIDKEKLVVDYENGIISVSYDSGNEKSFKSNIPNKFHFSYSVKSPLYKFNKDGIEAKLNGNILNISMPKVKEMPNNAKRITVQ